MNILFITNHLNTGGITTYVFSLAKALKEGGHNIYIASSGGQLLTKFQAEGIDYIPIPIRTKKEISPKIIFCLFKLKAFIKDKHIDLVHTHSRTTQVLGCLLNKFTGLAHISTCHGFFKKRLLRKLFPCWGQKVIAISEPVREHLIRDFKVQEKDIVVIHNGIDVDKFSRPDKLCLQADRESRIRIRKKSGLGEGPVIGIIARLSEVKGHIYLIEAMKIILDNIPSVQLLIVGEGREEDSLLKKIDSLGITKSVFFIPDASDTKTVLSAMDIFVMPSLKEGLGLALMEAMACGLAVVGSDVGGIKSLIQDEINGLLVKPKDPQALASAILRLLNEPRIRESLGKAARRFISEKFSLEEMVGRTERVYRECLNTKY